MLDLPHLPWSERGDVQVFQGWGTVTGTQWQTWQRPRGASMCQILCIGGGGGGGGGHTAAAGSARGGGGGGGSSGTTRVTVPCFLLPERLYIQVGTGGAGGAASTGGGISIFSLVSIAPDVQVMNILAVSGAANPGAGTGGSAGAAGVGGAAGTAAVIGSMPLAGLGHYDVIAGQAGVNGGSPAGAVGQPIAIPVTSALCQGGSGGAGTTSADFAGGLFTALAGSYLSEQRPATPAAGTAGHGSGGPQLWKPFFSFGGGGGSSANAARGANGGHGAYGAGGGGGGGGTIGGTGGDGGPGLVMIFAW